MKKITIQGAYGETNFGDDLLMCVFENYFLKNFQGVLLNFQGERASYVLSLLQNSSYNANSFSPDWLVYGGGTQFFSFTNENKSLQDKLSNMLNNPSLIIKKLFGRKTIFKGKTAFLGFGIGPFSNNKSAENTSKSIIEEAHFVGVRDAVSEEFCNKWNVKNILGADVVFSSYFDNFISPIKLRKPDRAKKQIGVIVRDWDWDKSGNEYIDKLYSFCKKNKNSYNFTYIIFAPKKDPKWLKTLENENTLIWNPKTDTISSFLEKLNNFDSFISARYHGAIVASFLEKPVICIEIEQKLEILTKQIPQMKLWKKPFIQEELLHLLNDLDYGVNYKNSLMILREKSEKMLNEFVKISV